MKRKLDAHLISGILILTIGTTSAFYNVSAVILNFFLFSSGVIFRVKDLFFDIVFILLGLLLLRKKKIKYRF
ncbi:MAG TPA: hypothetical protein ENH75_10435 [archaeon]|nr:hypothetical protein [archaeon]